MRKKTLRIGTIAILLQGAIWAQDITGRWQGTLQQGSEKFRLILKIDKAGDRGWVGKLYSPDQFHDWGLSVPVSSVTLEGRDLRFAATDLAASYKGKMSADGDSLQGNWTQGQTLSLEFERATSATEWKDPTKHTVQFVTVETNVKLEVLDWGGAGPPLVFLAGGGATAHELDDFAPKFTQGYHVYGITRRGFGDSSAPESGYDADRLGDDVITVLDTLKLSRPVLIGQSIAGEELSSVGSRHPERVAGLIYLDAAYAYAYYDSAHPDVNIELIDLEKKLKRLEIGNEPQDLKPLIHELLEADLPEFEKGLRELEKSLQSRPKQYVSPPEDQALQSMFKGMAKYTNIPVPILAIYALPHDFSRPGLDASTIAAMEARDQVRTGAQADAFEKGVPTARVVRLPHASHDLIRSRQADVLREMNAFLKSLP